MATTTTTATNTILGTSNLRGSSSRTRNLPARTSRNVRGNLRQNSLLSIPTSAPGQAFSQTAGPSPNEPEPHGFYPAISHFTDAITALPRDFRRHTSLLKEVDAKAWASEENLQKLLQQCLHERQSRSLLGASTANTVAGSVDSVSGDTCSFSAQGSVVGNTLDNASQYSATGPDSDVLRRRRLYAELRSTLMQMIMPIDEKNHVISNANEELSKHIRRQDEIWPSIADEISEETRLGSLKHWALVDLNPPKKILATARGRDAVLLPDNEVAERSERRREAMALAKKQKTQAALATASTAQQLDSDTDLALGGPIAKKPARKGVAAKKVQELVESIPNAGPVAVPPVALGTKASKPRAGAVKKPNEPTSNPTPRVPSGMGGTSMSRENSQQEGSKKRKAPAPVNLAARKRLNAAANESPKLAHSPLAGTFSKDVGKKSPALQHVRPVNGRVRQNSAQSLDTVNRPSSAASKRNGITATGSELERVAVAMNKTTNEVKQTMKESLTAKGEKMLEEDVPDNVDNKIRGGILLERTASKSSQLRREDSAAGRRTASPRLNPSATFETKSERSSKGKGKVSTPQLGTFADTEASESNTDAPASAENGNDAMKQKRPARPRMKDHHGLHDSLSPKGLPTKRTHKKNGSYSIAAALATRRERDDDQSAPERKVTGRTNSRSLKAESSRDGRHGSSTPKIGSITTEFVEEPDSIPSASAEDTKQSSSRRVSQNPKHSVSTTSTFDVRPPASSKSQTSHRVASPRPKAETPNPNDMTLGSPGPEIDGADDDLDDDLDADDEPAPEIEIAEEDDEEDPNEQRYCYCNGVSYGEMVACDNESCAKEWFHLECTGLRSLPPARTAWYCEDCRNAMVA